MLLRTLSVRREPTGRTLSRYLPDRQYSEVWEDGRWVPSWSSRAAYETKKADVETGEDNKGT